MEREPTTKTGDGEPGVGVDIGVCSEARVDEKPAYEGASSHLGRGSVFLGNCIDADTLMFEQSLGAIAFGEWSDSEVDMKKRRVWHVQAR